MEIRDLADSDIDAAFEIRTRSFGVLPEAAESRWKLMIREAIEHRLVLACYRDGQLAGLARINRFEQWWRGRSVPMAGVAGVVVAPEHRARGVARRLMLGVLQRAASHGFPVSALYPATMPLYRGCGWEVTGAQHFVTVPTEALRTLAAPRVPLRRVGPADVDDILTVVRAVHAAHRSSGPINWDPKEVRHWLATDRPFAYLAEDGFLAYHWEDRDLEVDELVAGSEQTARALWSTVGSGSSVAKTVRACVDPEDPVRWLVREPVVRPDTENLWMLRLLDLPAAIAARGYPAGVSAEVTLVVDDPQLPDNSGTWLVRIADSTGKAERIAPAGSEPAESGSAESGSAGLGSGGAAGSGRPVRLGPRGLAALYAGTPLPTLRVAGLVTGGDPATDALLDTGFAARPYLLDYF